MPTFPRSSLRVRSEYISSERALAHRIYTPAIRRKYFNAQEKQSFIRGGQLVTSFSSRVEVQSNRCIAIWYRDNYDLRVARNISVATRTYAWAVKKLMPVDVFSLSLFFPLSRARGRYYKSSLSVHFYLMRIIARRMIHEIKKRRFALLSRANKRS